MKITECQKENIDDCLRIAKQLTQYFTKQAVEAMAEDLKNYSTFIARESEQTIGFINIYPKNNKLAEVNWLAVAAEHQQHGVGSALVEYAIRELKSKGIRLIEARTLSEEVEYEPYKGTRKFYEKMGFTELGPIENPTWDPGNTCAIYLKILR